MMKIIIIIILNIILICLLIKYSDLFYQKKSSYYLSMETPFFKKALIKYLKTSNDSDEKRIGGIYSKYEGACKVRNNNPYEFIDEFSEGVCIYDLCRLKVFLSLSKWNNKKCDVYEKEFFIKFDNQGQCYLEKNERPDIIKVTPYDCIHLKIKP